MSDNALNYRRSAHFQHLLGARDIRHILTPPYTPRCNGKAERFIQTAKRDWAYARAYRSSAIRTLALEGFLNRYNRRRPHRALGNQTPLSRLEALV